jgi:hypothetical protein
LDDVFGRSKVTDRVGIEDRLPCRLLPVLWAEVERELGFDGLDRAGGIWIPNLSRWTES